MKSILLSIKPKYVADILNGKKTIEIRKQCPKQLRGDTVFEPEPINVYIYCTKEDSLCKINKISRDKYVCGKDFDINDFPRLNSGYEGKGKVVAKFTLYRTTKCALLEGEQFKDFFYPKYQLTRQELKDYVGDKPYYEWHIEDLVIFDKPKELWEFKTTKQQLVDILRQTQPILQNITLTKAPQSYCYVEVEK